MKLLFLMLLVQSFCQTTLYSQSISVKFELSSNLSFTQPSRTYTTNPESALGYGVQFSAEYAFNEKIQLNIGLGFDSKQLIFDGYYFAPNHSNGSYHGDFDFHHNIKSQELILPVSLIWAPLNNERLKIYTSFGVELKGLIGNSTKITSISTNSIDWSGKSDLRYWDNISSRVGCNGLFGVGFEMKRPEKRINPFIEFKYRVLGNRLFYGGNDSNDLLIANPNLMMSLGFRLKNHTN